MPDRTHKQKSICFIFPHPVDGPTGGYKVVYEYASRLAADGYEVHIVYSGSVFWKKKDLFHKFTNCIRYVQSKLQGFSSEKWFLLNDKVKEYLTFSMNYRHVPKCDVYIATSPYTAFYLNEYPIEQARKFYFIQDKEDWGPGLKAILEDTYRSNLNKIVISSWLQNLLAQYDQKAQIVPNGFDFDRFRCTKEPSLRDPFCISMLYHFMERKDCATGFKALEIVKNKYPQLRVLMFGTPKRPADLPEWYTYFQNPSDEQHLWLNNEASIFVGTSKQEGWGLTVGEAMICGQAVVCTDNSGYLEMAEDERNALVVPVGDVQAMADAIIRLIEDCNLRAHLAEKGRADISRFTWDKSYQKLKSILLKDFSE